MYCKIRIIPKRFLVVEAILIDDIKDPPKRKTKCNIAEDAIDLVKLLKHYISRTICIFTVLLYRLHLLLLDILRFEQLGLLLCILCFELQSSESKFDYEYLTIKKNDNTSCSQY